MSQKRTASEWWVPAAPYLAILIGLFAIGNAWIAALLYHGLILLWLRGRKPHWHMLVSGWRSVIGIPMAPVCATGGLLLYLLWSHLGLDGGDLRGTLSALGLRGSGLWIFCSYFSTVGAVLEELFWRFPHPGDSRRPSWRDAAFAGYHALVLILFVELLWTMAIVFVLFLAAWIWKITANDTGGLAIPVACHIAADVGVVAALFLLLRS